MFENTKAFSGFAVSDLDEARDFYGQTLGLKTSEDHGLLTLHIAGDRDTLVYPKPDHA
ncbi:MAG: Glyoxalase/bleomycin resistance protein/dioxygenase, partial [Solirubrobacterales bacterium]|nr:Glyoxalase/bleomycin resistance protein/dioxygenase [Solirubrobacterales bacterium]